MDWALVNDLNQFNFKHIAILARSRSRIIESRNIIIDQIGWEKNWEMCVEIVWSMLGNKGCVE